MVIMLSGMPAAMLSAGVAIPGPPLLPSIAKSVRVILFEFKSTIGLPLEEFLRFNVVPYFPAPWSQTPEFIETPAAGSMMQVPGGMMIVALPRPALTAELSAAWRAAESSLVPSHFIPVAKTGFMMQVLLIE